MKYWEIIARNLKRRGWSYGYVSVVDSKGRTIWVADAHRGEEVTKDFQATVAQLTARLDEQATQIQKVSAQLAAASPSGGGLEASKPASQVVNNP